MIGAAVPSPSGVWNHLNSRSQVGHSLRRKPSESRGIDISNATSSSLMPASQGHLVSVELSCLEPYPPCDDIDAEPLTDDIGCATRQGPPLECRSPSRRTSPMASHAARSWA